MPLSINILQAILDTYRVTCSAKLKILTKYKEDLKNFCGDSSSDPPRPPVLCGDAYCGFVPTVTNVVQSTASFVIEHRDQLKEGDESKANVIGSMNLKGVFWIRILPRDGNIQDVMLLNLTNTMR